MSGSRVRVVLAHLGLALGLAVEPVAGLKAGSPDDQAEAGIIAAMAIQATASAPPLGSVDPF